MPIILIVILSMGTEFAFIFVLNRTLFMDSDKIMKELKQKLKKKS